MSEEYLSRIPLRALWLCLALAGQWERFSVPRNGLCVCVCVFFTMDIGLQFECTLSLLELSIPIWGLARTIMPVVRVGRWIGLIHLSGLRGCYIDSSCQVNQLHVCPNAWSALFWGCAMYCLVLPLQVNCFLKSLELHCECSLPLYDEVKLVFLIFVHSAYV